MVPAPEPWRSGCAAHREPGDDTSKVAALAGLGPSRSGFLCFGSIRTASLVMRRFRSEETGVRSNKVTIIWGILTLVSVLALLVLMALGVVSI